MKWTQLNGISPNQVLSGEDFYISYNPAPCLGLALLESDGGSPETALCVERSGKSHFLILNGDFREEYEEAFVKGLGACLRVFIKHQKEHGSSWTSGTDFMEWAKRRALDEK